MRSAAVPATRGRPAQVWSTGYRAELPTREEITIAQEALKEVIGEKGSEKRAAANKLAERGLIDLEEGLGHWLGDRFVGVLPAGEELARGRQ